MDRLAYAAHTRSAIFFLDEAGICQELAPAPELGATAVAPELLRCVGAQYVASLDLAASSGLVALPREGASMLFVVADAHMRFSLVRTAPVERFETLASIDEIEEIDEVDELSLDVEPDEELELQEALAFVAAPDVRVAWPTGDALARSLPLPPSSFNLMAPPRRTRGRLALVE